MTDARGSISPLGGCRQRTGRGLSLTRRILSTCLLLRTGSRVRYGGGGLAWERRACVTVHWRIARGSGRNDHTPCSDMKSQVLGERVASRKPCAARGLARSSTQYLLCDEEESWRAESQARRLLVTRRAARACGLRAPGTWRPVRLNEASWGDDICIGSAQATRVGAISAGEMDVLAPGKKDTESPHFSSSEWCFWRRTSLSRSSSNGKSPRRFSLAFITSAKPEKGGHRLCLNRAWVRFPPSHAPPLQLSPPVRQKRHSIHCRRPPFFPPGPRYR